MLSRHDPAPLAHVLDDFEGDSTERLTGFTAPAVADLDPEDVLLYIYAFAVRRRPPKNCDPALLLSYDGKPHSPLFWVKAGNRWHVARLETDRKRLLSRAGRCVRVERDRDGSRFFVRVYHLRRWVSLLPLAFCVLLLALSLTLCGSPSGSGIAFLEGQSKTSSERTKPIQQTDFASYTATPDTVTWRAGETRQDISLSLPANCSVEGKEETGNPVCSTVAIACDLDSNGKFDDSEIVWSATDPDSGSPLYIRPGFGINHIDLSKPLAAGEYRARTIWRSVLLDAPSTSAGSASFDWLLKVVE